SASASAARSGRAWAASRSRARTSRSSDRARPQGSFRSGRNARLESTAVPARAAVSVRRRDLPAPAAPATRTMGGSGSVVAGGDERPGQEDGGRFAQGFLGHRQLGHGHRLRRIPEGQGGGGTVLQSLEPGAGQDRPGLLGPLLVGILGQRITTPEIEAPAELPQGGAHLAGGQVVPAEVGGGQELLRVDDGAFAGGEGVPA